MVIGSDALARIGMRVGMLLLAAALGVAALAFLVAALYLAWASVLAPMAAALVTGLSLLLLAAAAAFATGPRRVSRPAAAPSTPVSLLAQLVPLAELVMRRRPFASLGIALAVGAVSELLQQPAPRKPR